MIPIIISILLGIVLFITGWAGLKKSDLEDRLLTIIFICSANIWLAVAVVLAALKGYI